MGTVTMHSPANTLKEADYRHWGKDISDALTTLGFPKTDDTGQVNWDTAVVPTLTNWLHTDYEIRHFSDALQDTAPLFFKLTYGRASGASGPCMTITLGKGSTGNTGTITDILGGGVSPHQGLISAGDSMVSSATGDQIGYVSSGDGSMLAIIPFCDSSTNASPTIIIDRSRDSAGTPNGEGVAVMANGNSSQSSYTVNLSQTMTSTPSNGLYAFNYASKQWSIGAVPVIIPHFINDQVVGGGGGLAVGVVGIIFPWTCHAPGLIPWQMLAAISWTDDPGGEFTARVSGASRNYLRITLSTAHCQYGQAIARQGNVYGDYPRIDGISTASYSSGYIGLAILWA